MGKEQEHDERAWLVEQRYRAVLEVLDGSPVSEVAVRYGVSRQCVYAWKARHAAAGWDRRGAGGLAAAADLAVAAGSLD